jgi:hypothetical protein
VLFNLIEVGHSVTVQVSVTGQFWDTVCVVQTCSPLVTVTVHVSVDVRYLLSVVVEVIYTIFGIPDPGTGIPVVTVTVLTLPDPGAETVVVIYCDSVIVDVTYIVTSAPDAETETVSVTVLTSTGALPCLVFSAVTVHVSVTVEGVHTGGDTSLVGLQ